jgi:hypothetical protein
MVKLILKTVGIGVATAAIAVLAASNARADETVAVNVKVPFAFIVGDVRLPAGEYDVREVSTGENVLEIVSADGRHFALTSTIPFGMDRETHKTELVFQTVGRDHFLSRVAPSDGNDREIVLTPSIMEREIISAGRAAN